MTGVIDPNYVPDFNGTNSTQSRIDALSRINDAANAGQGAVSLDVGATDLVAFAEGGGSSLVVSLVISNFLGSDSEPATQVVSVRTDNPPNLVVQGGRSQTTKRPRELSVRADAIASSCDGRPAKSRGTSLGWAIFQQVGDELVDIGLVSSSKDAR